MRVSVAIVGAGPYGLSIAAHLGARGVSYCIFGRPMDTWTSHMPKGMLLKSDGFASSIYTPGNTYSLSAYCAKRGIAYSDKGLPVRLDVFGAYGMSFRDRFVPELQDKQITSVERSADQFVLKTDQNDTITAKAVVLAVGVTHFSYTPPVLADAPAEFVSHSYEHADVESLRGKEITILGGGSSAIDLAAILHEAGVQVQLVARVPELKFHDKTSSEERRSLWKRLRSPDSGLGPGIKSRLYSEAPSLFRHLPEKRRLEIVRTFLGPAGGWFAKAMVVGKVPMLLGRTPKKATVRNGKLSLELLDDEGSTQTITTDHVIAATGYRADIDRLKFLSAGLRSKVKRVRSAPLLGANFESSVPGLYFVGLAAANTYGPSMRFAFGAKYVADRLSRRLSNQLASQSVKGFIAVPRSVEGEHSGAD
jgi:thioredoxin reductase